MTIDYKFRMPRELLSKLQRYADGYNFSKAEIARRALRRWTNRGCVAVADFEVPATRATSVPYTLNVDSYVVMNEDGSVKHSGKVVCAVINWYLDQHPEKPDIEPFVTEAKPGIDYVLREA